MRVTPKEINRSNLMISGNCLMTEKIIFEYSRKKCSFTNVFKQAEYFNEHLNHHEHIAKLQD